MRVDGEPHRLTGQLRHFTELCTDRQIHPAAALPIVNPLQITTGKGPAITQLVGDDGLQLADPGITTEYVLIEQAEVQPRRVLPDSTDCPKTKSSGAVSEVVMVATKPTPQRPQAWLNTTRSNSDTSFSPSAPLPAS